MRRFFINTFQYKQAHIPRRLQTLQEIRIKKSPLRPFGAQGLEII